MKAPRSSLGGRYRFARGLQSGKKSVSWFAVDEQTKSPVVAASVAAARLAGLERVATFRHRHLAAILEVIHDPPADELPPGAPRVSAIAVAEFVSGPRLHEELREGPLAPADAVKCILPLIAAVESLEAIGGLHGAISPRSVVLRPDDSKPDGPVLTQLVTAPSGAYCSPERLRGRGPSNADDAWALHATLYAALTGAAPFEGASVDELLDAMLRVGPAPFDRFNVHDSVLERLVGRGLAADPAARETRIADLAAALRRWNKPRVATPSPPVRVPSEPPPSAAEDVSTDWDDDEAQTVVTTSSTLFKMTREFWDSPDRSGPAGDLADAGDDTDTEIISSAALFSGPLEAPTLAEPVEDLSTLQPVAAAPSLARPTPLPAPTTNGDWTTATLADPKPARRRRRALLVLALTTLGALGVAGYLMRARWKALLAAKPQPRAAKTSVAAPPRAAVPSAAPTASVPAAAPALSAPEAGALAKDGGPESSLDASAPALETCVAAHFPKGAFQPNTDFSFVCNARDLRAVCSKLHAALAPAGAREPGAGTRLWLRLGWYQLPAAAILRGQCCAAPARIRVPLSPAVCLQPVRSLRDFAAKKLVTREVRRDEVAFSNAATCFFAKGVPNPYRYGRPPSHDDLVAFKRFVRKAERLEK